MEISTRLKAFRLSKKKKNSSLKDIFVAALKVLIYHAFAIYLYPTQVKGQKDRSHVEMTRSFKILH